MSRVQQEVASQQGEMSEFVATHLSASQNSSSVIASAAAHASLLMSVTQAASSSTDTSSLPPTLSFSSPHGTYAQHGSGGVHLHWVEGGAATATNAANGDKTSVATQAASTAGTSHILNITAPDGRVAGFAPCMPSNFVPNI